MLLLIDNTINGQGSSPGEIRRALAQLHPDMRVVVESFRDISPELVKSLSPSHIILSGQSHPWDEYSAESLAGVFYVIRTAPQPILGVCGGQQQMALAFGARLFDLRGCVGFALCGAGVCDQFDCGDGRGACVATGGGASSHGCHNFCGGLSGAVFGLVVWSDAGETAGGVGVEPSGRGRVLAAVPVG